MAEGFLNRQLKTIDVFKKMPKDMSEGSIFGFMMTIGCFVLLLILVSNELIQYYSYSVEKGLTIDQKLDHNEVTVHLDILFPKHPCHLLGLDIVDYVGTHRMNLHGNIQKFAVKENGEHIREMPYAYPEDEVIKDFKRALKEKEGCRLEGSFEVLLVPGNFHIGFHSFGQYLNMILGSGVNLNVNFEHEIRHLSFGTEHSRAEWDNFKKTYELEDLSTVEGYSTNQMTPSPGPFSYHYKLMIFPTNLVGANGAKFQVYQYRSFWNVAYLENGFNYLASFDYELSQVTMEHKLTRKSLSKLLIDLSGIIGGIISFMTVFHLLMQKTVMKVLYKDSIGKLA